MLQAVEDQWVQRQIQDVAFERQQEIEEGSRVIVGVNEFEIDEEPEMDIEEVTEEDQRQQIERLEDVRETRDDGAVEDALSGLQDAAEGKENVMPYILSAVKAEATTGEICDMLRESFGEYHPGTAL